MGMAFEIDGQEQESLRSDKSMAAAALAAAHAHARPTFHQKL